MLTEVTPAELAGLEFAPPSGTEATAPGDVVILHGMLGAGDNWRQQGRLLAERCGVAVHALDLRGHGASPHARPLTVEAMAADVAAWIDERVAGPVVVLGHSLGGRVAMHLALTEPHGLAALVVADIGVAAPPADHAPLLEALAALELDRIETRRDADAALAEAIPERPIRMFLLKNLERGEDGWRWRMDLEGIRAAYDAALMPGLPEGTWKGPALFLRGERSPYIDAEEDLPAIREHFPAARLVTLPDAGHWLHAEAPEVFAETVGIFLASVAGAGD